MAAGNWTLYQAAKLALTQAGINLGTDAVACVLVTSGYTPVANTHSTYADISANEATGIGYTAGGVALSSQTDTAAAGTVTYTSGAVSLASSTITAKYAVLVRRANGTSTQSTDKLICFVDLNSGGGSVSTTNGTFLVTMSASGILEAS